MKIETIYKVLNTTVDPVGFFNRLRTSSKNAFLLESADIIKKYGDKSIGCVDPCLKIVIKQEKFTISALNKVGKRFLVHIKEDFEFVNELKVEKNCISGIIKKTNQVIDEDSRLKQKSVFDVLRIIAFKLKPRIKLDIPFCGLFGAISYDAIDYFEDLPKQCKLENETPDMEFYYADKLFVMDHLQNKTYLIANQLVFGEEDKQEYYSYADVIRDYERVFKETAQSKILLGSASPLPALVTQKTVPNANAGNDRLFTEPEVTTSLSDKEFAELVEKLKNHIIEGDIFQCVVSRTFKAKITENPLDVYVRLKNINPGPYMFFFQNEDYTLLGSSPETCLKVTGDDKKTVEIKPIAGTLPRGRTNELDSRYELDLLLNKKELAEHCMLLDLARNDVAKVSIPSTRVTPSILKIEKFSHVQHLVSSVQGTLKPELDALHAYIATMNMGTLTGAPKIKAMELIRKYEKEKREFYGGAVCYLTPYGEFDSCIVIRAITIKNNVAHVRAGAGIVYDSEPMKEAEETRKKANACLAALGVEE